MIASVFRNSIVFLSCLASSSAATREEVADLERRAVQAFGTADEVARICRPDPVPEGAS